MSMGGGREAGVLLTRAAVSLRFHPSSSVSGEVRKASIIRTNMPAEPITNRAIRTRLMSVVDAPRITPTPAAKPRPKSAAKLVYSATRKMVRRRESASSRAKASSGPPRFRRKKTSDNPKISSPRATAKEI